LRRPRALFANGLGGNHILFANGLGGNHILFANGLGGNHILFANGLGGSQMFFTQRLGRRGHLRRLRLFFSKGLGCGLRLTSQRRSVVARQHLVGGGRGDAQTGNLGQKSASTKRPCPVIANGIVEGRSLIA